MIDFRPLDMDNKAAYDQYLLNGSERGCEYSFANLYLWGRQMGAFVGGYLVLLSQFDKESVYPYPVGEGDIKPVLDAIIHDAKTRGILCRFTGLTVDECVKIEQMYPGKFRIFCDRDRYDYVYRIDDLADLKGRKFQRKRNHVNRFWQQNPDCVLVPLGEDNLQAVRDMVERWFENRIRQDPQGDYYMERLALNRALRHREALQMESLVLMRGAQVLAMTMGSRLSKDTFDIHFEKAVEGVDGAYPAINQGFAKYLREKYPEVQFLNREDDLGLEGLRKAKLSYCPDHLVEKCWARMLEDEYEY